MWSPWRSRGAPKYTSADEQRVAEGLTHAMPSLDIAVDAAHRLIVSQRDQMDGLDTKAQISLGLIGVILAALYGNLKNLQDMKASAPTLVLIGVASVFIAGAAVPALMAYRVRPFRLVPDLDRMKQEYVYWTPERTKYVLFDTLRKVVASNLKEANKKAGLVVWSHRVLAVGIAVLFVTFLVNLLTPVWATFNEQGHEQRPAATATAAP